IVPGTEWEQRIWEEFDAAHLILLLISADFLASEFCYGKEMERAILRHDAGEASVIPVLLRACDWHGAPFGKLNGLPTDMEAITSWSNRDEALTDVAKGIRTTVEELSSGDVPSADSGTAGAASGSPSLSAAAQRTADKLEQGASLSDAVADEPRIPALWSCVISVSGPRGELPSALAELARTYESRAQAWISTVRTVLSPVLLIIVGGTLHRREDARHHARVDYFHQISNSSATGQSRTSTYSVYSMMILWLLVGAVPRQRPLSTSFFFPRGPSPRRKVLLASLPESGTARMSMPRFGAVMMLPASPKNNSHR
ncbi:MAG: type II secretion system F family protein, partial [Chloroflexi bacterium]|nr:type II secretion system F family protein [Chloroflexota bacterium]